MSKTNKIIYWIATIWLALGMVSTGLVQLFGEKEGTGGLDDMLHLGYPAYLSALLGILKIVGVVAVLAPGFLLLKEWAYAGFAFIMIGAMFSHAAVGDPFGKVLPALLLLVLTAVSWYFRPASRKLAV